MRVQLLIFQRISASTPTRKNLGAKISRERRASRHSRMFLHCPSDITSRRDTHEDSHVPFADITKHAIQRNIKRRLSPSFGTSRRPPAQVAESLFPSNGVANILQSAT